MRNLLFLALALLSSSCAWHPCTPEYHVQYHYLRNPPPFDHIEKCDRYLVFLVCARHLDYSNGKQLLKTIARHPSDGGKNSDVGHAWVLLHGEDGTMEGGHTGEFGVIQPRYFEGVAELIDAGDPNPVRYLWATQKDGCFQKGSGGFVPSFAARVNLTEEQYRAVRHYILSSRYPFSSYAITRYQCATLVAEVAKLIGLDLDNQVTVPVEEFLFIGGGKVRMWTDPCYAKLTISSPDILEKSLMQAVEEEKALNATKWYLKRYPKRRTISEQIEAVKLLKSQYLRSLQFN